MMLVERIFWNVFCSLAFLPLDELDMGFFFSQLLISVKVIDIYGSKPGSGSFFVSFLALLLMGPKANAVFEVGYICSYCKDSNMTRSFLCTHFSVICNCSLRRDSSYRRAYVTFLTYEDLLQPFLTVNIGKPFFSEPLVEKLEISSLIWFKFL